MQYKNALQIAIGLAIALALSPPASCQRAGGGGGGGAGGGGLAGGAARTTTPPTTGNNPSTPTDLGNRGLYLSGKVQMDDGTAPPQSIVIERVCGGYRKAEGYTDSKGRFSFQLGQEQGITEDASYSDLNTPGPSPGAPRSATSTTSPRPAADRTASNRGLAGCEVSAVLAGFRSDSVSLSGRRVLDNPDIGTIILH